MTLENPVAPESKEALRKEERKGGREEGRMEGRKEGRKETITMMGMLKGHRSQMKELPGAKAVTS